MDALLNLLPGGPLSILAAAVAGVILTIWRTYRSGKKAGANEQKLEEAKRDAQHLERVRTAAGAQPAGSVQSDPYNRDNK